MLQFKQEMFYSRIVLPNGEIADRPVEIRTHPITGRTCRITYSRGEEREPGAESLPKPPPFASEQENCPFCSGLVDSNTPRLPPEFYGPGHMKRGSSILFPNLFPYGRYSAVSLFDDEHYVEIGTANLQSYADSFLNCRDYLQKILAYDPAATFMAITQNHLPSAGGSLLHPHLQVQADRIPSNYQRYLQSQTAEHLTRSGTMLFSDYLAQEKKNDLRFIGTTGPWQWLSAFAPEGFFEIWGILPGITSLNQTTDLHWSTLARGVLNVQSYYRSIARNSYNLGLLLLEDGSDNQELCVVLTVRSNYAPWVRNDFTGFEVMLGDMATFTSPESIAEQARVHFQIKAS